MDIGASPSVSGVGDIAPYPPVLPCFLPLLEYPPLAMNDTTDQLQGNNTSSTSSRLASTAAMQRALHRHKTPQTDGNNPGIPKQSYAHEILFTKVLNKKAKAPQKRPPLPLTGILLTRVGPRKEIERKSINMGDILTALLAIDPHAFLLPHNRDPSCMVKIQTMLKTGQDYTTFMDITRTNWGKPTDNKTRIAMSFYVASDIIIDGLEVIKKSRQFQDLLGKYKLTLLPHNLLQSDSKAVAFFSGKSPVHTWQDDLRRRFKLYLDTYLQDTKAVLNIFGEDAEVPTEIPFYFKVTTLRNKTTKTSAVSLYVGRNHISLMQTLLEKVPFPDVQLILFTQRRHAPDIFAKQIFLHHMLCEKSRAVKLQDTTEEFRLAIAHEIREDDVVGEHIIDVAEASSTAKEGTLYIQCVEEQKPLVITYVREFLEAYAKQNPNDTHASIVLATTGRAGSSSASPLPTVNTWNKFQSIIGSASTVSYSDSTNTPSVPTNIHTQQMYSYAAVTSGNRRAQPSTVSSPTISRTNSISIRDPELEKELQDLKKQVQTLLSATKTSPASSTTSSITSHKSKREVELESKISRLESLVGSQMEVIANLQKTMEALNAKLDHDGSNTSGTTNSYRKRVKTGPSPRKTITSRQEFSSESESDHDMDKPQDSHEAHSGNPRTGDEDSTMDAAASDLNGGIHDDDITESILPDYDDTQENGTLSSDSIGQEAPQDDHDL